MRRTELLPLEWQDIYFATAEITVAHDDRCRTRSDKTGFIPISDELMMALKHRKQQQQGSTESRVFPFSKYQAQRNLSRAYRKAGIKKDATIHTLRHTFASRLVMQGVDINTVSKLLGHSDIQTTQIHDRRDHFPLPNLFVFHSPVPPYNFYKGLS